MWTETGQAGLNRNAMDQDRPSQTRLDQSEKELNWVA